MAAIVTDSLKKLLTQFLYDNVINSSDSDEYYVGIGKADDYNAADTVITPVRTTREERIARANLQSVIRVGDASFVIPRYNWTSGTIYTGYNDSTVGIPINSYYVLTEENRVYICIQQGRNANGTPNASTVKPDYTTAGVNITEAFETADGYRWKYLYTVTVVQANTFLSANYMPIDFQTDSSGALTGDARDQALVQEAATAGQILGANIVSGGSGYTTVPTVTINGNGSGAAATATISGGAVVKVEMNNESAALGSGYNAADIAFSGGGGTGASARPIIGPVSGIGADARDDLKANSVMLNVKPDGAEGGTFVVDNDFRQVTIIKNIEETNNNTHLTASSAKALKSLKFTTTIGEDLSLDGLIRGGTSDAAAFIDEIDSDTVYYHQNENTGFGVFVNGETITESDGAGSFIIDSSGSSLADPFSGEVLYIENRARVIRSAAQQEDIKVIITI